MTSLPSLALGYWISWGFYFAPYGLYQGQTALHWNFTPLTKMQPQQSHVSSTGLYSLRKTWQFLVDEICNNLASGAGSLHLVPVGGMLYIQQETSNPNFPFRQESGGGLGPFDRACILPHSPASCLPARPAITSLPGRQHWESQHPAPPCEG